MPMPPATLLRRCLPAVAAVLAAGCGTVTLPSQQPMQILAFDANDRPVTGMDCTISNIVGEWKVSTPAIDVPVRRSHSELQIECRRGTEVAMGTVAARRDGLEQALVPFGSLAVAIDHLTGHLYSYPTVVRLRVGQHLRYEFSNEARAAGLIATVGETMVVDLGAAPVPREPLPDAGAAPPPAKPVGAARPVHRSAASGAKAAAAPAAPAAAPRPSAPVNW